MNDVTGKADGLATFDTALERDRVTERLGHYDDVQAPMRALLALEAGRMGSWRWDIGGGTVTGDPFVADLLNMNFDAQPWSVNDVFASMHPEDLPRVQGEVDKALAGADLYEVEFRDRVIDPVTGEEGLRWLGARGRVTQRSDAGEPLEMIGVNWDATQQKTHEQRLAMLAGEMDHRVKNAFAVIRALISLGERVPGDKKSFAETLKTQVQAMSDAHAISARMARAAQAPSASVPVAEVIRSALAPWMGSQTGAQNTTVHLEADESILILPRNVSALAMLAYELATNATKYGPLGEAGGTLDVSVARDGPEQAVIRWHETTDDPAVARKAEEEAKDGVSSGFGSVLVQHCVNTLRGKVKRDMTPKGLRFELHMPVPGTSAR